MFDQLDLLVGEGANLLAKNDDGADQLAFLEHRHGEDSPIAGKVGGTEKWMALNVRPCRLDVGDVDHLLRNGNTSKGCVRRRSEQRVAHACLDIGGRGVVRSNWAEEISVSEMQRAELGLADARRVL